jgi:hypothetical protein
METIFLFCSTLVQVFMISMQSIAIIKNKPMLAAFCASLIASANVISLKIVPDANAITIVGYIIANAIAVPLAMWIGLGHHHVIKKK